MKNPLCLSQARRQGSNGVEVPSSSTRLLLPQQQTRSPRPSVLGRVMLRLMMISMDRARHIPVGGATCAFAVVPHVCLLTWTRSVHMLLHQPPPAPHASDTCTIARH